MAKQDDAVAIQKKIDTLNRQLESRDIKMHMHLWQPSHRTDDRKEKKCSCGRFLVTPEEIESREAEWNDYFKLVTTTPSYLDFMKSRNASKDEKIEIAKRATERIVEDDYLPKPNFPDPIGQAWRYVVSND